MSILKWGIFTAAAAVVADRAHAYYQIVRDQRVTTDAIKLLNDPRLVAAKANFQRTIAKLRTRNSSDAAP